MPFEFTGAPPALLDKDNANIDFKSFAQQRVDISTGPLLTTTASSPVAFGQPAALRRAVPLGQSKFASSQASPSTFSNTSSAFAGANLRASTSYIIPAGRNASDIDAAAGQDNILIQALSRAVKSRPAAFGRRDIAADKVMNTLRQVGDPDIGALLASLRTSHSNSVHQFALSIFTMLVDEQTAPEPIYCPYSPTPSASPTPPNKESSDEHEEDEIPDSTLAHLSLPRNHDFVKDLEKNMQVKIRERLVHYEEGAKVLAKYILNRLYKNDHHDVIVQDMLESTGHPSTIFLSNALNSFAQGLLDQDALYKYNCRTVMHNGMHANKVAVFDEKGNAETDKRSAVRQERVANQTLEEKRPFRFLELPAELRNWVYAEQLAPQGYIALGYHSKRSHYSKAGSDYHTDSECDLNILLTSRQVYEEAKAFLYRENTVCLTGRFSGYLHSVFHHHGLRKGLLSQLASISMVCDYRQESYNDQVWLEKGCDWRALQDLTTLKRLRICVVQRQDSHGNDEFLKVLLKNILDRIPADCEVDFESQEAFEIDYVQEVVDVLEAERSASRRDLAEAYEVEGRVLCELANDAKSSQGCKNGSQRDFRFPEKLLSKSVKALIAAGEVNPNIVLGGDQ